MRTLAFLFFLLCLPALADTDALAIADELPAMDVLERHLYDAARTRLRITTQDELPAHLSDYPTVIVYIHHDLKAATEKALIDYAENGGRLILLHHTISSAKRANADWFRFLGIELPNKEYAAGGYKYFDPVDMQLVNLAPGNYVTTNKVRYHGPSQPAKTIDYQGKQYEGFELKHTEAYVNHVLTGPHTILLGMKTTDPQTGKEIMQDTAGWYKKTGKGMVFYFMAGHNAFDFDNNAYSQIIANAVMFERPDPNTNTWK